MKVDPPLNMNNRGYVNFPFDRHPEKKEKFDDLLNANKTELKQDTQTPPSKSDDNKNYNRPKLIGSDALSFLESSLLGSTSIRNMPQKDFPSEVSDKLKDEVTLKTGQFDIQLEKILNDFNDTKVDIIATNANTQLINSAPVVVVDNSTHKSGNIQTNANIINPGNIKTTVNKATQNNINMTPQKDKTQSQQQFSKVAASFSEIAAKVFQDKSGLHLVLRAGKLNDREIEDLEVRVMQLLGEFNIQNPKLDILSKQEKE